MALRIGLGALTSLLLTWIVWTYYYLPMMAAIGQIPLLGSVIASLVSWSILLVYVVMLIPSYILSCIIVAICNHYLVD